MLESVGVLHFLTSGIFLCLQRHRLGVQCSSIYAILTIMMVFSVFNATVASIAEFCVLRVAISISESDDH